MKAFREYKRCLSGGVLKLEKWSKKTP